jgi:hypothetical protein
MRRRLVPIGIACANNAFICCANSRADNQADSHGNIHANRCLLHQRLWLPIFRWW